jgi:hypothetical protein
MNLVKVGDSAFPDAAHYVADPACDSSSMIRLITLVIVGVDVSHTQGTSHRYYRMDRRTGL